MEDHIELLRTSMVWLANSGAKARHLHTALSTNVSLILLIRKRTQNAHSTHKTHSSIHLVVCQPTTRLPIDPMTRFGFCNYLPTIALSFRFATANHLPVQPNMPQNILSSSPGYFPLNLQTVTAVELHQHLVDGTITSVELVHRYLEQIAKYNDRLNAVIETAPLDILIAEASKRDAELKAGKVKGVLHGIPILVKDNINTHPNLGMHSTSGSFALKEMKPKKSAEVVEKLIQAGALVLGKANLSELAYFKDPKLPSGWSAVGNQTLSAYVKGGLAPGEAPGGHSNPGGSSSGSAVGVSAGFAPLSIGTETDGSLIMPANRAGLYTIKPTHGLVSIDGILPGSIYFDSAGPMAKSALDLAHLLTAIISPDKDYPYKIPVTGYSDYVLRGWGGIRIGTVSNMEKWIWGPPTVPAPPGVNEQLFADIESAYQKLRAIGVHVEPVDLPLPEDLLQDTDNGQLCWAITRNNLARDIDNFLKEQITPVKSLREIVQFNIDHSNLELPQGHERQGGIVDAIKVSWPEERTKDTLAYVRETSRKRGVDMIMATHNVNIIIGPADSALSTMAGAAGYPLAALPLGILKYNGRPFGVAALASGGREDLLVQLMGAWEKLWPQGDGPDLRWVE